MLLQCQRVEQGLRGVLVGAVAGVDHRAIDQRRNFVRRTVLAVPEDEGVGLHGAQRACGVGERFAFLDAAMLNRERDRLRAEAGGGLREAHRGAGAVFVETIEDGSPRKPIAAAARIVGESLRRGEQGSELRVAERRDGEEVHGRAC